MNTIFINSKNNKISAPTWNEELDLLDRSCSISDIQDYFEYILKKHGEKIDDNNPSIKIYVNKIEITIRILQDKIGIISNFNS